MEEIIKTEIKEHIRVLNEVLSGQQEKMNYLAAERRGIPAGKFSRQMCPRRRAVRNLCSEIKEIVRLILDCYKNKGKVVLFGNGGSAADAQHIAAELVGKYKIERKSLPAIALTTNASTISAIGNDYGFERVFEKQVEGLVDNRDIVIGISTSGNSENVIKGILKAQEIGAKTIAFTGRSGGKLKDKIDVLLNIPSDNTPRIQETHILVGHIICGIVEKEIFKYE